MLSLWLDLTGLALHQWLGLAVGALAVYHSHVYHTPCDALSAVSPEAVAAALGLAVDLAGELDAGLGR